MIWRATIAVSASLTTDTRPGSGEYAKTGTTWNCDGAMNVRSIVASGCSRLMSIPVSSCASRSAVATGPSSAGSEQRRVYSCIRLTPSVLRQASDATSQSCVGTAAKSVQSRSAECSAATAQARTERPTWPIIMGVLPGTN